MKKRILLLTLIICIFIENAYFKMRIKDDKNNKENAPRINRCFFENWMKCKSECDENDKDFCWCATRVNSLPEYECQCIDKGDECPDFPIA